VADLTTSILVFTRDLRIRDNPALTAACAAGPVVPLFVLDDAILARHSVNATRLEFLLASLRDLDASLRSLGGHLVIRHGPWTRTVLEVASQAGAGQIHLADDVSGYAARRLAKLRSAASSARIGVVTHPGVTVAGPQTPHPASGGPYLIFTPYYRKWQLTPRRACEASPARLVQPPDLEPGRIPSLAQLADLAAGPGQASTGTGSPRTGLPAPAAPSGGETAGLARLTSWSAEQLAGYDRARDDLAADATSRLSPFLHFGCLSPLMVATELSSQPGAEPFIRQLAWRDFFCQLLAARPDAAYRDFNDRGDQWHDDPDGLAAWQEGQTGYPVIDAAMRQLTSEGFMHNRARMIVASFLTKDLYVDWRAGAAYFMARLADADLASNQLNWQWVAGTGTDRQPFRIFNPTLQSRRFDREGRYIARYVPELAGLAPDQIHDPLPEVRRSRRYPAPIVDHQAAAAAWRARQR
jgi:deoxyribodipyrimidine photo-lyase